MRLSFFFFLICIQRRLSFVMKEWSDLKNSVLVIHFTAVAMVLFLNNECNYQQLGFFVVGLHSLDSLHLFYLMDMVCFYFSICKDSYSYLYCFLKTIWQVLALKLDYITLK